MGYLYHSDALIPQGKANAWKHLKLHDEKQYITSFGQFLRGET